MTLGALQVAWAAGARADDKPVREAEARFQEGLARVKGHDFEAARLSFEQAYAVLHRPLILWNLALAEEKTGHIVEALQHFRQVEGQADDPADRANAQRHVDALMAGTGHVEVKAPPGTLLVVDGGAPITAPIPGLLDVLPGRHVIDAKLPDGSSQSLEATAEAGQIESVSVVPAASAPVSSAVAPPPHSAEAPHVLEPPAADATRSRGEASPARAITTASLGGAAVVAIGLGVYFGLDSRSHASSAQAFRNTNPDDACVSPSPSLRGTCSQWSDDVRAENRDAIVSDVAYVAGGVLAAAAVATWFLWPNRAHGTGAWVLPAVGPSTAGLSAGGAF